MKKALILFLFFAQPAFASTVAFEDQGVLSAGSWQFNTILGLFPQTQQFTGGRIQPNSTASFLTQINQEFRYGITDRLMVRTTLSLGHLQEPYQATMGLGDGEFFLKALLVGTPESPFQAATGFQVILPTAFPSIFSANGAVNLIPSLMLKADLGGGALNFTGGYQQALGAGGLTFCGLGWNRDWGPVNLVAEGVLTQDPSTRLLTFGPGMTWAMSENTALIMGLQFPLLRQGDFPSTGPYTGLVQISQTI